MALARDAVLWAADNRWLREHLPRYRFVRRSVRRFMPGETLDDAIAAAKRLKERGLPTMFTALGENVTQPSDALRVVEGYRRAYGRVAAEGLETEFSVKPSHLGLDQDPALALANLHELATVATESGLGTPLRRTRNTNRRHTEPWMRVWAGRPRCSCRSCSPCACRRRVPWDRWPEEQSPHRRKRARRG